MGDILTIPEAVQQWKLGGKSGNLCAQRNYTNNTGYNLFCRKNEQFLTFRDASVGINLGYIENAAERKVHFVLPDGSEREVLSGEPVALGIGGSPSFLKHTHRTFGINLAYADMPAFEWRLFAADTAKGKPIPTGAFIAIVNEHVEPEPDFLIHLGRPGADVGWTTSPDWKQSLLGTVVDAVDFVKKNLPL